MIERESLTQELAFAAWMTLLVSSNNAPDAVTYERRQRDVLLRRNEPSLALR